MSFTPLVKGKNFFINTPVFALLHSMNRGAYRIPDFQRDSSQWELPKRSLFIESIINGLAVPPLIAYQEDDPVTGLEIYQVIDGQQRLTTIKDFVEGKFSLSTEDDADYSDNIGALIGQKSFYELDTAMQDQINDYVLNFLILPKGLDPWIRRSIFRRINEGGLPLSRHDLRLSDFGDSSRVSFMRIAGIFDCQRPGAVRMLAVASKFNLHYPWKNSDPWQNWWADTRLSTGQAPSEMFLHYVVARDIGRLDTVLSSAPTLSQLREKYDRTTASVLDIYCAQATAEEISTNNSHPQILAPLNELISWFADFELWFNELKTAKVPGIKVNSSTKIAHFIASASQIWSGPNGPAKLTDDQWELAQLFLTQGPAAIATAIGIDFPISKGKWPGQKKQIQKTYEICERIKNS